MDPARLWMLLNELAARLGVEVRLENLANDDDYLTSGGLVKLGGKRLAIVDKSLSPAARTRQLGLALINTGELGQVYLKPAVRDFLESMNLDLDA